MASLEEARNLLDELVDEVATGKTHVIVERNGKPLMQLVPTASAK